MANLSEHEWAQGDPWAMNVTTCEVPEEDRQENGQMLIPEETFAKTKWTHPRAPPYEQMKNT